MAASGTIGILRALLTADASAYAASMKKSADATKAFGSSVAAAGATAQKVTPQLTRMEKAFSGDKLLYSANNLTRAITNIGGASKLTAAEQAKVNRQLTEAIEKYRALGQTAPKAMLDLERATRSATTATTGLSGKMVALGTAVGSFIGTFASNLLQRGISTLISLGTEAIATAGKIDDLSKKLGISAEAVQGFSFAAEQSGTTIDAFAGAITRLSINLAEGDKSTANALKAVGLELGKLRTMRPEDALLAVADALAKIENPMERVRLGTVLMGRGFAEILPAVLDGLRQMVEGADKMSNDTVKRLAAAEDAWAAFRHSVVIQSGAALAALLTVVSQMTATFDKLQAKFAALINFSRGLLKAFPGGAITAALVDQLQALTREFERQLKATEDQADRVAPILGKTKEETDALTEAQRKAAEAARAQLAAVNETRSGLEALGLVTRVSVIAAYEEFANMQHTALVEGTNLDAFLIAMLPTLTKWAEAVRRSGVEPLAELEAALAAARAALLKTMPAFEQPVPPFLVGITEQVAGLNEELQRPTTPAEWWLGKAQEALKGLGVRTREEQDRFVEQTRQMWAAIVKTYGEGSREATEVLGKMTDEQLAIIGRLPTYWQHVIVPTIGDALSSISRNVTQTFGEMLVRLETWKDGFIAIWRSIKQAIANILADILQNFIQGFLKQLVAAIARQRLGNAVGGLFGGGGGVGLLGGLFGGAGAAVVADAAPNIATAAGMANATAIGGGAAAGGTAAGAGFGTTMAALASNPLTWGVAGGALLAWGIGKKGWFRGGEEGTQVNPARDRFLKQFGGFNSLAALLTSVTGEPGGGRLFTLLAQADTMREFTSASQAILTLLSRRGVTIPNPAGGGRLRPSSPLPALTSAAQSVTSNPFATALPATPSLTGPGASALGPQVTMHVNIQAWDRADLNDAFRTEIIPRFKDALQFNQAGLRTAVQTVGR